MSSVIGDLLLPDELSEAALAYLNEKYGGDIALSPFKAYMYTAPHKHIFYAGIRDDTGEYSRITEVRCTESGGELSFTDNYMIYLAEEKMKKRISEAMKHFGDNISVFLTVWYAEHFGGADENTECGTDELIALACELYGDYEIFMECGGTVPDTYEIKNALKGLRGVYTVYIVRKGVLMMLDEDNRNGYLKGEENNRDILIRKDKFTIKEA